MNPVYDITCYEVVWYNCRIFRPKRDMIDKYFFKGIFVNYNIL